MKTNKYLYDLFGKDEFGLPDLPVKISNVQVSRALIGEEMGCSYCFPHRWENYNGTMYKNWRNWKHHRKTQYKP